ncbi:MAG: helix-turn-helix domain-containing protein [Stellaceae bacterium]
MIGSDSNAPRSRRISGPSISAIPSHEASDGKITELLSERERNLLGRIAVTVRFGKGDPIYRAGDPATFVYNVSSGVAMTYRTLPDGTRAVVAFLFPDDLFGLSEEGAYVNSAEAVTPMTAHRLPVSASENLLRRDPTLEWHVLVKLCHTLREEQRHSIILSQRGALARLAIFLQMLDRARQARDGGSGEIYLPMSRSDIADYIGLSLAAVSRSFRTLTARHLIAFRDRRHLQIVDQAGLASLIAQRGRE